MIWRLPLANVGLNLDAAIYTHLDIQPNFMKRPANLVVHFFAFSCFVIPLVTSILQL